MEPIVLNSGKRLVTSPLVLDRQRDSLIDTIRERHQIQSPSLRSSVEWDPQDRSPTGRGHPSSGSHVQGASHTSLPRSMQLSTSITLTTIAFDMRCCLPFTCEPKIYSFHSGTSASQRESRPNPIHCHPRPNPWNQRHSKSAPTSSPSGTMKGKQACRSPSPPNHTTTPSTFSTGRRVEQMAPRTKQSEVIMPGSKSSQRSWLTPKQQRGTHSSGVRSAWATYNAKTYSICINNIVVLWRAPVGIHDARTGEV